MMTPKEKAVDIFYKYFEATNNHYIAKECAFFPQLSKQQQQ